MPAARPLERVALKFCRQAVRKLASVEASPRAWPDDEAQVHVCRVNWMLPELACLIVRHHERSPNDFALTVRRFVDEHTFVEDAGDPVFDDEVNDETQLLVEVSLRVHRAIHHRAQAKEDGESLPVPPLMFG